MPDELIQFSDLTSPSLIKIIGVGGGGGNAVAQMYRDGIPDVQYLVVNTDSKALEDNPVPTHLQLGPGLGAGGNPEKGRTYAEENVDKIREIFDENTHMVFITAGMGGGTGTGASPIIAREARRKGLLTVGIVTIPFLWEREKQIDKALDGLEKLATEVDSLLVINNERLRDIYHDSSVIDAFRHADETLSTAVGSITEIISMHGRIGLDFEDVRTVLTDGGIAVMSSGYGEGEGRLLRAINDAITSPLLNQNDVFNATHLIYAISTSGEEGETLGVHELDELNDFMAKFNPGIITKWGLTIDPSLGSKVKFTVLASGFGLYSRKNHEGATTEEEVNPEKNERRFRFYPDDKKKTRRHPNYYIFSEEDMLNPDVVESVEETPTRSRTYEQLNNIKAIQTK